MSSEQPDDFKRLADCFGLVFLVYRNLGRMDLDYKIALIRINQILRSWANYFKHAVAKHTMARLHTFVWWRVIRWVMHRHRMTWTAIRRWLRGP
ncbi:group II intron maturase-specific domain-containing protein [Streptomyces sp. V1I1]|uniref:group II intron maturase-specific domain-containing protein n=1 Tax=Streptomyces sp. V1I1 TaxID=3042272 RepID=UPI0027D81036|nr:group II intron maturase-specific domain-containing protein [Streptomyces sp. V1I1]